MVGNLQLFMLSVALGTDLFSVAIPIGMNRVKLRVIVRAAVVFAAFHIVLILAGYYIGHSIGIFVEHFGAYHTNCTFIEVQNGAGILGSLVLIGLGVHMIKENLSGTENGKIEKHPLRGMSLFMLATGVSVDALAAGFSMGMMDVNLVKLSIILGIVIFLIAVFGLGLGRQVGRFIGKKAELVGGSVLILLGAHIIWNLIQ